METSKNDGRSAVTTNDPGEQAKQAAQAAEEAVRQGAEQLAEATEQIEQTLAEAGDVAQSVLNTVGEKIAAGARATDSAIRKNPYQAAGVALVAGLLIGYLLKRK